MKTKQSTRGKILAVAVGLIVVLGSGMTVTKVQAACDHDKSPVLFDVIYILEGRDIAQAENYFDKVSRIVKRHGLVRVQTYRVMKAMKGIIPQPALINIWRLDNPNAMQALGSDPEYHALVPLRNSLFDMKRVSILKAQATCR